jgi:transcriptional regulator with XRE-family HTH domain
VSELREAVAAGFGRKLTEARARAKLSQEELGYRSEIHRTQITRLEAGESTPGLDTLIKLAGALGVDPPDLLPAVRWEPPDRHSGRFSSS